MDEILYYYYTQHTITISVYTTHTRFFECPGEIGSQFTVTDVLRPRGRSFKLPKYQFNLTRKSTGFQKLILTKVKSLP